jgi:hypothetical protein
VIEFCRPNGLAEENFWMSKKKPDVKKPDEIEDPRPPAWMSRPQRRMFSSIVETRKAAGRPILTGECEILHDLISCRARIATLTKLADVAVKNAGSNIAHQRHAATLLRQVDAATALARRLTRDLRLIGVDE